MTELCRVDHCHATFGDLAGLREHELYEHGLNWAPTVANINALPESLRRYIHDLETRCDPAGELRELVLLRDENAMLRRTIAAGFQQNHD